MLSHRVQLLCNLILPSPSVYGISQQEYLSRLPCPPPADLPNPGIEHVSCTGRQILCHWATREAQIYTTVLLTIVTMLFITSPVINFFYFDHFHPFHLLPTLISGNHQSILCIHKFTSWFWCFGFLSFFFFFLDTTYKWVNMVFLFLFLIYFTCKH